MDDVKVIIQPMLEVMAISEVAKIPDENVPIVNILVSHTAFRPVVLHMETLLMPRKMSGVLDIIQCPAFNLTDPNTL